VSTDIKDQFLRHVAQHEMRVLHDQGVYRHLRFQQPGTTNLYFDIVTWPGFLAYTGDMGDYVFNRVEDMLTFFRGHRPNPQYWAEKCVSVSKHSPLEKFSETKFKSAIKEALEEHIDARYPAPTVEPDAEPEPRRKARETAIQELRDEVDEDVLSCLGDDMDGRAAIQAAVNFVDSQDRQPFGDIYENDFTEWTYRFLWCCEALPWAIALYDARPVVQEGGAA
jgi:hypothetical protein